MELAFDSTESSFRKKCDFIAKRMLSYTLSKSPETSRLLNFYRSLSPKRLTNQHILKELSWVVYSSGFRYDIVRKYWQAIEEAFHHFEVRKVAPMNEDLEDHAQEICRISGFRNLRKATWCIKNANRIVELDKEKAQIGGLRGYIMQLSEKPPQDLVECAPNLVKGFGFMGIGNTTIFHLLKNLGFNIFKPDIHVRRVLTGLKLISDEYSPISEISDVMLNLSCVTGLKITELDTLLFVYGKITGDQIHKLSEA